MIIKNLKLKNNVFLAPMAGVTDMPFRILCMNLGCGLAFSEMVSAKGISYKNEATKAMLAFDEAEHPVALQLFGREPKILHETAKQIEHLPFDVLDFNMGCPAPKIVKNGEGSALLKEPSLVYEIVKGLRSATNKPLSVKIRKGFDENSVNAVEIAKIIEAAGADMVTVHGRTREQYYSGVADWNIICQVKQSVNIKVVGNGDIFSPTDAKKIVDQTGCDGVMIGRAAHGNPWIFQQTAHFLETGELLPEPTFEKKIETAKAHAEMLVLHKGEYVAVREMRKHLAMYIKGLPNCAKIRVEINKAENIEQLFECL